jgi:hypothetical protein
MINKLSKQFNTDNNIEKKITKPSKSILLDTATLDNDAISTQIKKQMSKSERLLRNEYTNQFEEVEAKITATRKTVDSRLHDFEHMVNEKVNLIDQKILESQNEKSYQFHERNVENYNNVNAGESSFQNRSIQNQLKAIENRL